MAEPNATLPALDQQDVQRFWMHVIKNPPHKCWPWRASRVGGGYGQFKAGGRMMKAHRVAYFISRGVDPGAKLVCHSCDYPPCCNPAHLFLGTPKDNRDDCKAKGRTFRQPGDRHWSRRRPERVSRGERVGGSRLTAEIVLDIRTRFASGESQQSLADLLGVDRATIKQITLGKNWKHVGGPIGKSPPLRHGRKGEASTRSRLKDDDIREIRKRIASGESNISVAKSFNVTPPMIGHIIHGRAWTHVA